MLLADCKHSLAVSFGKTWTKTEVAHPESFRDRETRDSIAAEEADQKLIHDLDYLDGENQGPGVPETKVVPKRGILRKRSGPRKKRACKEGGADPG